MIRTPFDDMLKIVQETYPDVKKENIILAGYRGSHAYGTVIEDGPFKTKDEDIFIITHRHAEWYMSLDGYYQSREKGQDAPNGSPLDYCIYDIRKFFALLANGNPNAIEWLFIEPEDYLYCTPVGRHIIKKRAAFLSERTATAIVKYLENQLDRGQSQVSDLGAVRKEIIDQYGYDFKMASHCIRLLVLLLNLRSNKLSIRLEGPPLEAVKALKQGQIPEDAWLECARECMKTVKTLPANLPEAPDMDDINSMLVRLINHSCFWD